MRRMTNKSGVVRARMVLIGSTSGVDRVMIVSLKTVNIRDELISSVCHTDASIPWKGFISCGVYQSVKVIAVMDNKYKTLKLLNKQG